MIHKKICPNCSYEQIFSTDLPEKEAIEIMDKKCRLCHTKLIEPKNKKMVRKKK
jgi:DNA polymerase III alpha subunit (gram-positive type)